MHSGLCNRTPDALNGVGFRQAGEVLRIADSLSYLRRIADGKAFGEVAPAAVIELAFDAAEQVDPANCAAAGSEVAAQSLSGASSNSKLHAPVVESDRVQPRDVLPPAGVRVHAERQRAQVRRLTPLREKNNCAHGSGDLHPQDIPLHVGPEFFAKNWAPKVARDTLNDWAILGRHPVPDPGLYGLVAPVLDVQEAGGLYWPTQNVDSSLCRLCTGFLDVHSAQCTQDSLALPMFLALPHAAPHEKLAVMDIHQRIKARREELKMSKTELARRVSAYEDPSGDPTEPITRQTIQHWESGAAAPKRSRLGAVAAALGLRVTTLISEIDPVNEYMPEGRKTLRLLEQLAEIQKIDPHGFERLADNITKLLDAMRQTDAMLRVDHGVTGYVSPKRAEETLGRKPPPTVPDTSPGHLDVLLGGNSQMGDVEDAPKPRARGAKK